MIGFGNRIGSDFDNVSQRLVYNYIATQPDFRLFPRRSRASTRSASSTISSPAFFTALYHNPADRDDDGAG